MRFLSVALIYWFCTVALSKPGSPMFHVALFAWGFLLTREMVRQMD